MNALKREYFHVPLYAWLAGGAALVLSVFYFLRSRNASTAVDTSAYSGPSVTNLYADTTTFNSAVPGSANTSPPPQPTIGPTTTPGVAPAPAAQPAAARAVDIVVQKWPNQLGSLSGIAAYINKKFGTHITWQQIYAQNRNTVGANPNLIYPGQHIKVTLPAQGGAGANAGDAGAALLPAAFNPTAWRPQTNDRLFDYGNSSPLSPQLIWNMIPTAAYTQV